MNIVEMRLKKRAVHNSENEQSKSSLVLHWTQGHPQGTRFQCFARTGDGSIAVGSYDGRIRLYSRNTMKQAKTVFPSLGSPITHVDVTRDGKWILATTDTFLILVHTLFTDKDGKRKTGFHGRMGNKFQAPLLLKLAPSDSQLAGLDNKLQGGEFSWVTKRRKEERHLLATVGEYSVLWNFQQVKDSGHECYRNQQGLKSCYCYKLLPKDELIIESRVMHNKHDDSDTQEGLPLAIATPMKVTSVCISCPKKEEDDDAEMK